MLTISQLNEMTDRELEIEIARRRGCVAALDQINWTTIYDKGGNEISYTCRSEPEAWGWAFANPEKSGLNRWAKDGAAAMELLKEKRLFLNPSLETEYWYCHSAGTPGEFLVSEKSPERAICMAWLIADGIVGGAK